MRDFDALIHASSVSSRHQRQSPLVRIEGLHLEYPRGVALRDIHLTMPPGAVTAIIGPSGCGKSTLLRSINRMNDTIEGCRYRGSIFLNDDDILEPMTNVTSLRRRVGMVFQRPNPFPKSIYDNIAYGPRIGGLRRRRALDEVVERCLRAAALWDEVKDRLEESALSLSLGQQQRLIIARTIAVEPEVLLLDEPASSLDPISTLRIEELIYELKQDYTVIIVTHNMQQAARVADWTAFMNEGRLIEFGSTDDIFTNPNQQATEDYITGRYG